MTIYRYGWIAWIWRGLAIVGLLASLLLVFLALRLGDWVFFAVAAPLGVPSMLLPLILAVRIDGTDDAEEILVWNLWSVRRRIPRESLGRPKVRRTAQAALSHIPAPRAWIPVRGQLPIYVDLYASIPDPQLFRRVLSLPPS